ncbi:MAG: DUF6587 family protein [Pseudomonadota bacterium]
MVQQAIVALIVLAAAGWATWYWMPGRWRRGLASVLARASRRAGFGEDGAARVAQALAETPGCSSCESCGSCATPGNPQGAAARAEEPFRPVKIVRKS